MIVICHDVQLPRQGVERAEPRSLFLRADPLRRGSLLLNGAKKLINQGEVIPRPYRILQ